MPGFSGLVTRRAALGLLAATATGLLAACAGGSQPTPTTAPASAPKPTEAAKPAGAAQSGAAAPTSAPAQSAAKATAGGWPDYYPANYAETVEASRSEQKLLVYSIMSKDNWKPVLDEFKTRYGWIDVEALDLGSYEVFERFYSESAGGARTADMIITSAPDGWQDFIKRGELADYKSPEEDKVPPFTRLAPGVYTASTDPMVFIWNKKLVQTPPRTMAELGEMVSKDASKFAPAKVVSYEENNATGFAANWFWAKKVGEDKAFQVLESIGKVRPKLDSSAGRMVDATLAGETLIGYFVSTISVLPRLPQAQEVLGWAMIGDGTPVIVRGMGVTKKAQSPNSAKLLLDFIMSAPGQLAFANGGLTAYRADVADQAKAHVSKLATDIGEQNLAFFSFDPDIADAGKREAFRARLKTALGRG
ncbi:MAG: substrate-binding domain-containing protein [Chloroflexota bacterium]|nr:substrate-binding domain-containing protein [Chloroflexota bacterium]